MQTSPKRCGLKLSSRKDMSAKFPKGGGGAAGPFLARSLYRDHGLHCGTLKLLEGH